MPVYLPSKVPYPCRWGLRLPTVRFWYGTVSTRLMTVHFTVVPVYGYGAQPYSDRVLEIRSECLICQLFHMYCHCWRWVIRRTQNLRSENPDTEKTPYGTRHWPVGWRSKIGYKLYKSRGAVEVLGFMLQCVDLVQYWSNRTIACEYFRIRAYA